MPFNFEIENSNFEIPLQGARGLHLFTINPLTAK